MMVYQKMDNSEEIMKMDMEYEQKMTFSKGRPCSRKTGIFVLVGTVCMIILIIMTSVIFFHQQRTFSVLESWMNIHSSNQTSVKSQDKNSEILITNLTSSLSSLTLKQEENQQKLERQQGLSHAEVKSLMNSLSSAVSALTSKLNDAVDNQVQKQTETKKILDYLKTAVTSLQSDLQNKQRDFESLSSSMSVLKSSVSNLTSSVTSLSSQLSVTMRQQDMKSLTDSLNSAVSTLTSKLNDAVKTQDQKQTETERSLDSLKSSIQSDQQNKQRDFESLANSLSALKSSVSDLTSSVASLSSKQQISEERVMNALKELKSNMGNKTAVYFQSRIKSIFCPLGKITAAVLIRYCWRRLGFTGIMSASKPLESGKVRIEPSLNKNEEEFVARRRNSVQQSLKKLQIKCSKDDVPNIALLGSGGGQRAMVGLLGSLVQLQKTSSLLDCVLYLSGVSGSTWCMASLYQEPDWSTKLEAVKDKIVQRLRGPGVSWGDAFAKLKKYYYGKDFFSMTDIWAVMVITAYVKEINEHTLTEQWDQQGKDGKDPFPIYTVIDKQSKQRNNADPWFEITPHEAGYSLTGAFVDASNFGSQFHNGSKKNKQNEFDMLYLQALCGSALADEDEIKKVLWQKIKDFFQQKEKVLEEMQKEQDKRRQEELRREKETGSGKDFEAGFELGPPEALLHHLSERSQPDPNSPATDECYQVLMKTVDMNLSVSTAHDDESIRTTLNDLSGRRVKPVDKKEEKLNVKLHTMDVCNDLSERINIWPFDAWMSIIKSMNLWIWGRNYNFLHNMTGEAVHSTLLESETRDFEDAGLLLNSPYFSVLRKERNIDLIISLDFSDGDPFMTVRDAAKTCRERNIPFPEVNIPSEDSEKPKDFYVFKGQNVPTVIHIPLFNVVNCGDKIEAWRKKYGTFQGSYSAEMITDLMEVAGKNILNNREKLVKEIRAIIGQKRSRRLREHI